MPKYIVTNRKSIQRRFATGGENSRFVSLAGRERSQPMELSDDAKKALEDTGEFYVKEIKEAETKVSPAKPSTTSTTSAATGAATGAAKP